MPDNLSPATTLEIVQAALALNPEEVEACMARLLNTQLDALWAAVELIRVSIAQEGSERVRTRFLGPQNEGEQRED